MPAARVPIRFRKLGRRYVPTVDLLLKMESGPARYHGAAMVDTGSVFTILAKDDLRLHRFPVHQAIEFPDGMHGIAGRVRAQYLPRATLGLRDMDNAMHAVNIQRLFLVDAPMPPIFGREALKLFNAVLRIDFNQESGSIELG